jgi:hypothetical protein
VFDEQVGPGLVVKISADTKGLDDGLNKSKTSLTQWRDETNKNTGSMLEWGSAIVATTAPLLGLAYVVHSEIDKFGTMAQGLKDLSIQTGMTTDKLQDLQYAALLSGTDVGKLNLALNNLTLAMGNAADQTGPAYKAFMGLGIDPKGRTPDEVFEDLAVALHNIKDPAEKAAIAQDIFGKSWKDMLPYMEEYIKNREEIENHQKFSEEDLKNMEDAKVGWDKLSNSLTIYEGKLFGLLGVLQKVADAYNPVKYMLEGGNVDQLGNWAVNTAENIVSGGQSETLKNLTTPLPGDVINGVTVKKPFISSPSVNVTVNQTNNAVVSETNVSVAAGKAIASGSALP